MTLTQDPYEATTRQLIENAEDRRAILLAKIEAYQKELAELVNLLAAYDLVIHDYREVRPVLHQNGLDPYADEARIKVQLQGLTNLLQRLVVLGIINNRVLNVNEAARLMHRVGAIGGQWKNVPPRCYGIIGDCPQVFERVSEGVYNILPGAESYLPDGYNLTLN